MLLVEGHVYESDTERRGLCVQCIGGECIVAWVKTDYEAWRMSIYDRDGKTKSEFAPRIVRPLFPKGA